MIKIRKIVFLLLFAAVMPAGAQNWEMVWEDQFNGQALDSSLWSIEEKEGVWNTKQNAELQHYRQENVRVGDDGNGNNCLIIKAIEEDYKGYSFTSGKVFTKGKFAFRRGKLEAAIRVPDLANGLWPAFWTLGYVPLGWPDRGEIDIMEMGHAAAIANDTVNSFVGAHLFWGPYNNGYPNYGTEFTAGEDLSQGYFIHTLIWDETSIKVYFNNASSPYFQMTITGNDFEEFRDYQHYIIFNLAVGGSLPGIKNKADITAPLPASMYVDWVRLYQEVGSADMNESLALFGTVGVYEERTSISFYMNHGFDLMDETSGLSPRIEAEPYAGDQALSYEVQAGQDFQISLQSVLPRNMINYAEGSVQFYMKTTLNTDFEIGIADSAGATYFVHLSDYPEIELPRDGSWSLVHVPLADLLQGVDKESLVDLLLIKGSPDSDAYFSIDEVIYSETMVPVSGYYGIYVDDNTFTPKFLIDNVNGHLYNWDNTVSFTSVYPPFEGDNVLSFRSSGVTDWFGFGIFSDRAVNLQNYKDGYLNISMITQSDGDFYIGMDADGGSSATIDFKGSSGPYGFQRDGTWQHLSVPMSDLLDRGLNLSQIKHVFKTGGGSIGNIAFDRIFLSVDEQEAPVGIGRKIMEPQAFTANADGVGNLILRGLKTGAGISIYTSDGRWVEGFQAHSEALVIPIASYSPGIYIITSVLGNAFASVKFVK